MFGTIIANKNYKKIRGKRSSRCKSAVTVAVVDAFTLRNTVSDNKATDLSRTFEVETLVVKRKSTTQSDFNLVAEKGEFLTELDKLTLSQGASAAKAIVTFAESQLKYAKLTYDRTKQLYESFTVTLAFFFHFSTAFIERPALYAYDGMQISADSDFCTLELGKRTVAAMKHQRISIAGFATGCYTDLETSSPSVPLKPHYSADVFSAVVSLTFLAL